MLPGVASPQPEGVAIPQAELRERYRAYRRRHASRLVGMLPKEAVRPLYRKARARIAQDPGTDPLATLVEYCESLVPLPPFEVWAADLAEHPAAHLRDMDQSAAAPGADAPSTLATRFFRSPTGLWVAALRGFRDTDAWRGFVAFQRPSKDTVHRTTLVFRGDAPDELRERFLAFENSALEAFLRSALP